MEIKKNWDNTTVEVIGTLKTNEDGKIVFTSSKFEKFSATIKIADDSPWSVLARKNTWVFMDGLNKRDVDAFKTMEQTGEVNGKTRLVVTGHLIRIPGKPGMNDTLTMKTIRIRPAKENENVVLNLDEALSRDEWQVIRREKFGANAYRGGAPTAPTAPVAPTAPF